MKRSQSISDVKANASPMQRRFLEPPKGTNNKATKVKQADTGADPLTGFVEFMKKDFIKPLVHTNVYEKFNEEKKIETEKWTIGTAAKCKSPEHVPKFQQFEDYYFPQPTKEEVEKWQNHSLKTNNLTLKFDEDNKKGPNERFMNLKSGFGSHTETYNYSWIPNKPAKTINNRSSVSYNILNNEANILSGAVIHRISDQKLFNMKKGVAEIADLTRPTNPNYDPKYAALYNGSPSIFKSFKGIFTHMYDASHKNGNISLPFRRGVDPNNDDNGSATPKKMPSPSRKRRRLANSQDFSSGTGFNGNSGSTGIFQENSRRIKPNKNLKLNSSPGGVFPNVIPATTTNINPIE